MKGVYNMTMYDRILSVLSTLTERQKFHVVSDFEGFQVSIYSRAEILEYFVFDDDVEDWIAEGLEAGAEYFNRDGEIYGTIDEICGTNEELAEWLEDFGDECLEEYFFKKYA